MLACKQIMNERFGLNDNLLKIKTGKIFHGFQSQVFSKIIFHNLLTIKILSANIEGATTQIILRERALRY